MAKAKLNGADYLLLLLYLNEKKPILGAIRLTKMMFLFEKEIAPKLKEKGLNSDKLPEFFSYNFGPFSKDLYEQVELFKGIKFIQAKDINTNEEMSEVDDFEECEYQEDGISTNGYKLNKDGKYYKYKILTTGEKYVIEKILPVISHEQIEILSKFKEKITMLTPKQILKYVYAKYPDYTDKSLIKDEVLEDV